MIEEYYLDSLDGFQIIDPHCLDDDEWWEDDWEDDWWEDDWDDLDNDLDDDDDDFDLDWDDHDLDWEDDFE